MVKNKQLQMFLASDMINFGDLITEELTQSIQLAQKREFSGNVFQLFIFPHYTFIRNLLDSTARDVVIETKKLLSFEV